ncbi:efflux transporter outer membrane subunit [Candidatus Nitronereus thalassa]|uniref:Efflux transporter outer membrane subunit n=1 Tax=Candidatus Nitronereus thalassa TaxID=3020898 RepID=A0ABU3K9E6_9BACT|nr:efflux transporter outer membrane subunit [Candidatus Nitronereus thalassa]MDT7042954.1 efflux transporter outer membrane subunit [Candidatus Nitronereus thalassa]
MMVTWVSMVLINLFLLGACTVGPDYQAPVIDTPEAFVSQDVLNSLNKGKRDSALAEDWWTEFSDPILNQLVRTGLQHNYQVAAALARLKEADARIVLADAGDNLRIGAVLDNNLEEERSLNSSGNTTGSVFGALGAVLPLDVFGRFRRGVEAAEAGARGAQADLRGIVLSTSSEITREYLRLRGNQRQLNLLKESVELQAKTLSIVRSRYKAGLSPELDLRRAETSVENLRAGIPPLKQALLNSRNRLASLTGRYPGVYEALLQEHQEIPVYEGKIPELVPVEVLAIRPDIRRSEEALKQAVARIGVAEADYYPTFQLIGQIGIGATGVVGSPTMDILIASLGTLINQIVTAGGARGANVAIATAQAEEALANYQQILREASEEVEASLAAINASRARQQSLQKAVNASEVSFYQAETLYKQGLISFIDVVDAQRVLANGEQQLAAERTNYATQIAILFRVLGTKIKMEA